MTRIHIEALRQNCIHLVEFYQPIPEEVLEQARASLPEEWFNTTTTVSPISSTEQNELIFTPAVLQNLNAIGCPFDCNGNGKCKNGMMLSSIICIKQPSYTHKYVYLRTYNVLKVSFCDGLLSVVHRPSVRPCIRASTSSLFLPS